MKMRNNVVWILLSIPNVSRISSTIENLIWLMSEGDIDFVRIL
jgi:hypothetical protein